MPCGLWFVAVLRVRRFAALPGWQSPDARVLCQESYQTEADAKLARQLQDEMNAAAAHKSTKRPALSPTAQHTNRRTQSLPALARSSSGGKKRKHDRQPQQRHGLDSFFVRKKSAAKYIEDEPGDFPCPLCAQGFSAAAIQRHASRCGEQSSKKSSPSKQDQRNTLDRYVQPTA